jgi:hypothetical protein
MQSHHVWRHNQQHHHSLTRGEVVQLRRLVTRLESQSLQLMAAQQWHASDAVSAMWAMAHLGHTPSSRCVGHAMIRCDFVIKRTAWDIYGALETL